MRPSLRWRLSIPGEDIGPWRSDSSFGRWLCRWRSCIWASTTWWTRWPGSFTWRARSSRPNRSPDGGAGARAVAPLRLPDLPHDRARELLRVVVRRQPDVDHLSRGEADLGMAV